MDWGDILGRALGGLGVGSVVSKWTSCADNVDQLRSIIRMDLSANGFNSGSIQACDNVLQDAMRAAAAWSDQENYTKAYIVHTVLLEEARGLGIIDG